MKLLEYVMNHLMGGYILPEFSGMNKKVHNRSQDKHFRNSKIMRISRKLRRT